MDERGRIQPGTAALFVLVRKVTADKVLEGLKGEGGTVRTTTRGIEIAVSMMPALEAEQRVACDLESLILCVKCGGSDYTSGLAANPALGRVADRLGGVGRHARENEDLCAGLLQDRDVGLEILV